MVPVHPEKPLKVMELFPQISRPWFLIVLEIELMVHGSTEFSSGSNFTTMRSIHACRSIIGCIVLNCLFVVDSNFFYNIVLLYNVLKLFDY